MTILLAIWKFLRGLPWQVYAAIGAALLIWQAIAWHGRIVEDRISAAYDAGVNYATDEFNKAQAVADAGQRAKIAALANRLETSNRELTNAHLQSRGDIAARADALRVRATTQKAASASAPLASNPAGLSNAACRADEAPGDGRLSLFDQIAALEQAELNTRQLIDLQQSILDAAAIWNQKDFTDDRTGSETVGEGNMLPDTRKQATLPGRVPARDQAPL